MSSPVGRWESVETGMSCRYVGFYGITANKIEAALHKCSTQLMMYQTVTDLCTTKYSSLLKCGAEQFPVF
jgi:hypothetical protein